jgi:hypothetical protein
MMMTISVLTTTKTVPSFSSYEQSTFQHIHQQTFESFSSYQPSFFDKSGPCSSFPFLQQDASISGHAF